MAKIIEQPAYTFDDVTLIPQYSDISSRFNGEIDPFVELVPGLELRYPIISANMDTITGSTMAQTMYELGGLGIIHHYLDADKHKQALSSYEGPKVACIGTGTQGWRRAVELYRSVDAFLIDTAHGDSKAVEDLILDLQTEMFDPAEYVPPLIVGNICTYDAAIRLFRSGVEAVKVGVGPGGLCLTRVKTGNGVPQLTAIMEVARAREDFVAMAPSGTWRPKIIADGGIRDSGDIVKALAAGADAVMLGSMFAGTSESLAILGHSHTTHYCTYRGMASLAFKASQGRSTRGVEGDVACISRKGSVVDIFQNIVDGILSGMSYQGAHTIRELQEEAIFWTQTRNGVIEGTAHCLLRQA